MMFEITFYAPYHIVNFSCEVASVEDAQLKLRQYLDSAGELNPKGKDVKTMTLDGEAVENPQYWF